MRPITKKQGKLIDRFLLYKKPIEEEVKAGGLIGALKLPWYFEKPIEKIILLIIFYLGLWKCVDLVKWIL